MEFQAYMGNLFNAETPNDPEKEMPTRPDKNPDPTQPKPGGNEPNKIDPTRIEEPKKNDPTHSDTTPPKSRGRRWVKVKSWDEARERMNGA